MGPSRREQRRAGCHGNHAYDANGDGNADVLLHEWTAGSSTKVDKVLLADGAGYFTAPSNVQWVGSCSEGHFAASTPVDLAAAGQTQLVMECGPPPSGPPGKYRTLTWTTAGLAEVAHPHIDPVALPGWPVPAGSIAPTAEGLLRFADLDGDALPDMLRGDTFSNATWTYRLASPSPQAGEIPDVSWGTAISTQVLSIGPPVSPELGASRLVSAVTPLLDQDGDGHSELTQVDFAAAMRSFSLQPTGLPVYGFRDDLNNTLLTQGTLPNWGSPAMTNGPLARRGLWYFPDVNGDGLKDALYREESATNPPVVTWNLRINTGAGYLPPTTNLGPGTATLVAHPSDLVFDELAGYVGKGRDTGLRIVDMNGDGRDDIVLLDDGSLSGHEVIAVPSGWLSENFAPRVLFANNTGFDAPLQLPPLPIPHVRLVSVDPNGNPRHPMVALADVDGNGLTDIIELFGNTFTLDRRLATTRMDAPQGIDVISSVQNQVDVVYDTLSSGSALRITGGASDDTHTPLAPEEASYPRARTTSGLVVRRFATFGASGIGRDVNDEYHYVGAVTDVTGRGFVGFKEIRVKDIATGITRTMSYDTQVVEGAAPPFHHYPLRGQPVSVVTSAPAGGQDSTLASAVGVVPTPHSNVSVQFEGHPLRMLSMTTSSYASAGTSSVSSVVTRSNFDAFGNPTQVDTTVTDAVGSAAGGPQPRIYSSSLVTTFNNDVVNWLITQPTRTVRELRVNRNALPFPNAAGDRPDFLSTATLTTDYAYNASGQVIRITREPGLGTAVSSDSRYSLRLFTRDAAGLMTQTSRWGMTGTPCSSTANCGSGRACIQTGPAVNQCLAMGEYAVHEFDTSGAVIEKTTNAHSQTSWTLYDPIHLWPYALVDANDVATIIQRDGFGRVKDVESDTGAGYALAYGQRLVRTNVKGGGSETVFFDGLDRPFLRVWSTFNGGSAAEHSTYDALGQLIQLAYASSTTDYGTASANLGSAITTFGPIDADGLMRFSARYDTLGRPASTTNGTSEVQSYTYPHPQGTVRVEDGLGFVTTTRSDHLGRLLQLTERTVEGNDLTTTYHYGVFATLQLINHPAGSSDRFHFDAIGRPTKWSTSSTAGTTAFSNAVRRWEVTYDGLDRERTVETNGRMATFTYDELGRVLTRSSAGETQTFTWDPPNGAGQLESASTAGHETHFTYDPRGRVSEQRENFDGGTTSLSFGFGYDSFGRLRSVRYPEHASSGDVSAHAHTQRPADRILYFYRNGQVEWISTDFNTGFNPALAPANLYRVTERHPYGMVTRAEYARGTEATNGPLNSEWTYDPLTLRMATHAVTTGVTEGPLPSQQFSYFDNGAIWRKVTSNVTEDHGYDGATDFLRTYRREEAGDSSKLVHATFVVGSQGLSSVSAAVGTNATDWPGTSESYAFEVGAAARASYRLTTHAVVGAANPVQNFGYDANGRVSSVTNAGGGTTRTYQWNSFDLPTQVQDFTNNTTRSFSYDAFGNRTRKIHDATNRIFYIGKLYEQRRLPAHGRTETVYRVFGETGQLFEIVHPWGSTTVRRIRPVFTDYQGSVTYKIQNDGPSVQRGYFPYGRRMGTPPTFTFSDVGYTGHLHDDDLGLINMGGRIFDVTTRRFLTRDILPDQPFKTFGTHPYAYVGHNPTNLVDPSGFAATAYQGSPRSGQDIPKPEHGALECIPAGSICSNWPNDDAPPTSGPFTISSPFPAGGPQSDPIGAAPTVTSTQGPWTPERMAEVGAAVRQARELDRISTTVPQLFFGPGGALGLPTPSSFGNLGGAGYGASPPSPWGTGASGHLAAIPVPATGPYDPVSFALGTLPGGVVIGGGAKAAGAGYTLLQRILGRFGIGPAARGASAALSAAQRSAFLQAGLQPFKNSALTVAGRALTKHPELVGLTKATLNQTLRSPGAINAAAEGALGGILQNGTAVSATAGRFGQVVDVIGANGFGARFSETGRFIGFLNP